MSRTRTRNTTASYPGLSSTTIEVTTYDAARIFNGNYYRNIGTYTVGNDIYLVQPGKMGEQASITDETQTPGSFNRVVHTKEVWNCPLQNGSMSGNCTKPFASVSTTFSSGCGGVAHLGKGSGGSFTSDATMLAEASSRVRPQVVRPVFDVAQQIGEYLELANSVHAALERNEKYLASLKRADGTWKKRLPSYLRGKPSRMWTLNEWAKLAVSSHLGYKFAIDTTIQAILDYREAQKKVHARLETYLNGIQTLHGLSTRELSYTHKPASNGYYTYQNVWLELKEVRATVKVKYRTPDTLANRLRLLNALWGATPGVDTVYELYPLSFIVDFFVDFGSVLSDWSHQPIEEIDYDIISQGWSRKITSKSTSAIEIAKGSLKQAYRSVSPPQLITGSYEMTSYLRESKILDLSSFTPMPLQIRMPKAGQLLTIAEVAFAIKNFGSRLTRFVE